MKHGDGARDIAFTVENCDYLVQVPKHACYLNQNISFFWNEENASFLMRWVENIILDCNLFLGFIKRRIAMG